MSVPSWNQIAFHDPASPLMYHITGVHDSIMLLLTFIVSMITYIFISVLMWDSVDLAFFSNETLEFVWVTIPMIVLLVLAIPSLHCLYLTDEAFSPLMSLKVIGHQWFWSYEYDSTPVLEFDSYMVSESTSEPSYRLLETDTSIVVPVDIETRVLVTSADVIHSFALPSMGLKMDAIPGRVNQLTLLPNKLGIFYGQCSEMCGAMHSFMPVKLEVIPLGLFGSWLTSSLK